MKPQSLIHRRWSGTKKKSLKCFSTAHLCFYNYTFLDVRPAWSDGTEPKAWELATSYKTKITIVMTQTHSASSSPLVLRLSQPLVLVCPPSLRHAAVPVERLILGYNVLFEGEHYCSHAICTKHRYILPALVFLLIFCHICVCSWWYLTFY